MIRARAVTKQYPGADRPAVDALDLDVHAGEFLSLLGCSGSGKSTLLNILSSLVRPDSGRVLFEGADICSCSEEERNRLRREAFSVVFQQHHLMQYLTALENVLLPFLNGFSPVRAAHYANARRILDQVGLAGKENSPPGKLSGGEQQRVAIARALARGTRVLFADEPTGSLDSATGASIMELLRRLNKDGLTIVMVTHNPEYAKQTDRILTMADGRICRQAC